MLRVWVWWADLVDGGGLLGGWVWGVRCGSGEGGGSRLLRG